MLSLNSRFTLLSLIFQVALVSEAHGHNGHLKGRLAGYEDLSAQQILEKGLDALGGRSNLNALKGVTSHAL